MCVYLGTSPMTYTGLSVGTHRFVVRAVCPGQKLLSGPRNSARFRIVIFQ